MPMYSIHMYGITDEFLIEKKPFRKRFFFLVKKNPLQYSGKCRFGVVLVFTFSPLRREWNNKNLKLYCRDIYSTRGIIIRKLNVSDVRGCVKNYRKFFWENFYFKFKKFLWFPKMLHHYGTHPYAYVLQMTVQKKIEVGHKQNENSILNVNSEQWPFFFFFLGMAYTCPFGEIFNDNQRHSKNFGNLWR